MRRLTHPVLILVLSLGGSACQRHTTELPSKVVFCLFDLSRSAAGTATRQKYAESFKRILDNIGGGDAIVADAITDNPLSKSTFFVNEEFPLFKPGTDNPPLVKNRREEYEAQLNQKRGAASKAVSALLDNTSLTFNQTKILDAMQLAERVFHTYTRPKKVLVVFSDMIEASNRYNFQRQTLDESERQRIIAAEKNQRLLPDLAGVCVYVVGAAVSDQRTSLAFENIESFWIEYFRAAGGDLTKDRYGALLSFGECAARTPRSRQSFRVSLNGRPGPSSLSPGSQAESDQWLRPTSEWKIL